MYSHEYQNNPIDSKTVQLLIQQQKSFPKSSIESYKKKKNTYLHFFNTNKYNKRQISPSSSIYF